MTTTIGRAFLGGTLLLAVVIGFSGCDQVGTEPKGLASGENIFQDDGSYKSYLGKLYAGLNVTGQSGPAGNADIEGIDEGFSQYVRLWWQMQELPTDEAVITFQDAGGAPQTLQKTNWGPTNGFLSAMYARISFQVMQVNEFLRESTSGKLDSRGVSQEVQDKMPRWRAEARFLRALSYWHGVDLFGGIPVVTQEQPRGGAPPSANTRQEVFAFVESELLAIADSEGEENLPPTGAAPYGRADRAAAHMVLANLYLNAPVYLDNPQQVIGEDPMNRAVEYAGRVIDSGAFSLETNYQDLFLADNHTASGVVFAVPNDGESTQHYGGTQFLTHAAVGGDMEPSNYGIDFGYNGLRTTPEGVNLYEEETSDDRRIFFTSGQSLEVDDLLDFQDGYAVPKYQNVTSGGQAGDNPTFPDTDYPMFRLAEAYLIYAEATVRGASNGDIGQAVSLVNDLRQRAGLGRDVASSDLQDLDQSGTPFLLQERGRELFWEARRRMDLIRFGRFTGSEYTWSWKGDDQAGASIPDYRALYPLPQSELQVNPNLEQNTGY
ncbi:hypothetical protein GGP65_001402 [Salinibacter ruber]|jgi:hypothetical protein|uniref:RagB/SusD domain-containing protein n=2 Tax=Salinibacter ruber TaxID=146919 RepID=A0A9X2V5Z2_9BACT|nr:RagB/SusD family nutrient uptake outer membrane protein [Salinibacter ruber]MCS3663790.1 hypothetical protein [Salinibacter ruber]MCS3753430.1 hypothetical protein [Salinibacter ruber]MCS4121874.1 hypothetical protein [Salinibacter ruber]MCS4158169.1 hypothetical protein [Salinibacter ruber]MCS4221022.1 hypothetical protein [Salinibacter ruber]